MSDNEWRQYPDGTWGAGPADQAQPTYLSPDPWGSPQPPPQDADTSWSGSMTWGAAPATDDVWVDNDGGAAVGGWSPPPRPRRRSVLGTVLGLPFLPVRLLLRVPPIYRGVNLVIGVVGVWLAVILALYVLAQFTPHAVAMGPLLALYEALLPPPIHAWVVTSQFLAPPSGRPIAVVVAAVAWWVAWWEGFHALRRALGPRRPSRR